jgi:anti-anti-sigma factor
MPYSINEEGGKVFVEVTGEFDAILAKEVQNALEKCRDREIDAVAFDFKNTTHIASSGLRVIIFARERIRPGIQVSIVEARDIVLDVIKMSGIDSFVTLME